MSEKLTEAQDRVLRYLYENSSANPAEIAEATGLSKVEARRALTGLQELKLVGGPSLLANATRLLKELDPKVNETSSGFAEQVILMASVLEEADDEMLAASLGFDADFVATVGSLLRSAGIWAGNRLTDNHREAWMRDGMAFFCDANVASGDMEIVRGPSGKPAYKMSAAGTARVAKMGLGKP